MSGKGVFALKPLPIKFQNQNPLLFESFLFGLFTAVGVTWRTFQQGQTGLSVFFLCFSVVSLVSLLNLHPQIAGPSELFGDRIVLRTLFKIQEIPRASVAGVELGDMANPRSGTKFSFIILKTSGGKPVRITSKFGSIPELYLTVRAWSAQSSA